MPNIRSKSHLSHSCSCFTCDQFQHKILVSLSQQIQSTVKSRFDEWPPSAPFYSLNRDCLLNWDFLMWNSISGTKFRTLNRDFTSNRASLKWDFTVQHSVFLQLWSGNFRFSLICRHSKKVSFSSRQHSLVAVPFLMMASSTNNQQDWLLQGHKCCVCFAWIKAKWESMRVPAQFFNIWESFFVSEGDILLLLLFLALHNNYYNNSSSSNNNSKCRLLLLLLPGLFFCLQKRVTT